MSWQLIHPHLLPPSSHRDFWKSSLHKVMQDMFVTEPLQPCWINIREKLFWSQKAQVTDGPVTWLWPTYLSG